MMPVLWALFVRSLSAVSYSVRCLIVLCALLLCNLLQYLLTVLSACAVRSTAQLLKMMILRPHSQNLPGATLPVLVSEMVAA